MVFKFLIKVGIIAYTVDWLHRKFHENRYGRPTDFDRRIEDISRNVSEGAEQISQEVTPRVREWLHRAWSRYDSQCPNPRSWHRTHESSWQIPEVTELPGGRRMSVEVDVPGIKKEELLVTVIEEDRAILVKGKVEANPELGRRERVVEARVYLPRKTDLSDVNAVYEDGVLRVETGKKDYEGRKIPIA
ncbi:hypothetical protein BC829DRAFT_433631 [Chytridium lagenaria]|nr:hypothetical protein BC829DRAFT_433631 [Chytridium lagenaria]